MHLSLFLRSRSVYEKQTVTLWLENMKQSGDNIIIKIHEGEMSLSLLLWLKKKQKQTFQKTFSHILFVLHLFVQVELFTGE